MRFSLPVPLVNSRRQKRAFMIGDIFEQQRRAILARHLARDRAELFVPVDFGFDSLELVTFFQIVDEIA